MVEYFLQNYDGKNLFQHFLEMRKNYSSEDEKEDFLRIQELLKFNSPILKTGTNDIPQFIKNVLMHENITKGKQENEINNLNKKIIDGLKYLTDMCLGKLSTNIRYYFHIFELNITNKKFETIATTIKDLNQEHISILQGTQKIIKNFFINKLNLRKDTDTDDKFHNILCYFNYPSNGLVLNVDYIPPFTNITEYQHRYENHYTLDYIIESIKQNQELNKLNFYVSTKIVQNINSEEKYFQQIISQHNSQQTGGKNIVLSEEEKNKRKEINKLFNKQTTRVVYLYAKRNYTTFIILKDNDLEKNFYFINLEPNLSGIFDKFDNFNFKNKKICCCNYKSYILSDLNNLNSFKINYDKSFKLNNFIRETEVIKEFKTFLGEPPYIAADIFDTQTELGNNFDNTFFKNKYISNNIRNPYNYFPNFVVTLMTIYIEINKFNKKFNKTIMKIMFIMKLNQKILKILIIIILIIIILIILIIFLIIYLKKNNRSYTK